VAPVLSRVIEVRVEDRSPEMAAALANAYVEELDRTFRATLSTEGKRQRIFLEQRCRGVLAELDSLEDEVTRLQTDSRIVVFGGDLEETARFAGDLLGRRLALKIRLEMMDDLGVGDTGARKAVELELRAVEAEAERLPLLGADFAGTLRDLRIREVLYRELTLQLESARIDEARDTPVVEILDRAFPPEHHSRPRRGLAAVAGSLVGFALGFCWILIRPR
jgi:uncharacterized protein involved in exopolysaccharide biosynthesis